MVDVASRLVGRGWDPHPLDMCRYLSRLEMGISRFLRSIYAQARSRSPGPGRRPAGESRHGAGRLYHDHVLDE